MLDRPSILIVDDEPAALASMLDSVTRRFGSDYRMEPHLSARTALDSVARHKADGDEIALVIADQWMPDMTGNEFLGQVRTIEPTAKRALLVSWGDREASPVILQACALGQLDNYLYKPWSPAEVHLYPYVSEFLAEWTRLQRAGMELIHIAGDAEIMDGVGESPDTLHCDVVVVGGGPAGLTAAVYAGSEGLGTLVVERHVIGGQAGARLPARYPGQKKQTSRPAGSCCAERWRPVAACCSRLRCWAARRRRPAPPAPSRRPRLHPKWPPRQRRPPWSQPPRRGRRRYRRQACNTRASPRMGRHAPTACTSLPSPIPASWSKATSAPRAGALCGPRSPESRSWTAETRREVGGESWFASTSNAVVLRRDHRYLQRTRRFNMKHTSYTKAWGWIALSALVLVSAQATADDKADAEKTVNGAVTVLKAFSADTNMTWYRDHIHKARAVLIIPNLVKAGFIFGGSGGHGVVLARDERTNVWKGPSFATAGSVSWGLQAGASSAEVVMMAMTEKGKTALLSNKFQAGVDASVSAGPVGAGAQAATTDIIQFARSKGLFGGLSLEGSVIDVRDSLNKAYYGQPVSPVDILIKGTVMNPHSAPLIGALIAESGKK